MSLRVVSYGGGVQSTALLVLAAQSAIDFPVFVFANVGDDSEHPATLQYVRSVAVNYAAAHGIEMHEVGPARGLSLRERFMTTPPGGETIPIRGENGAPFKRGCTGEWKVGEVTKWLKAHGATPEKKAVTALGISTDEYERAKATEREVDWVEYPLLTLPREAARLGPGWGLSRGDCETVIRRAGLPVPRKSSCYFCPFHRPQVWSEMARDEPDLFEEACRMEEHMLANRAENGKRPAYLTRFGRPLREAIHAAQDTLALYAEDEGYRCGDVCDT